MIRVLEMMWDSDAIKNIQNAVTMKAFMREIKEQFDGYEINSDPSNLFWRVCSEFWNNISESHTPVSHIGYAYQYGDMTNDEIAKEFWDWFYVTYPDDVALATVDEY